MAKGKLRHVRVEPAANGALVTVSREPSKMQKGAMLYDTWIHRVPTPCEVYPEGLNWRLITLQKLKLTNC
jgi:hypothetical protein